MHSHQLTAGDVAAKIGNNEGNGEHLAGFNGIWSLTHEAEPVSPFAPTYAGMNLEHIFDGAVDKRDRFEPRSEPMSLAVDGDSVVLHQAPTAGYGLKSWTRFRVAPPDYVEFDFRCVPRRKVFTYCYIGLFWASYINAPEDKSLYFLGGGGDRPSWQQLCSEAHNHGSTVCRSGYRHGLKVAPEHPEWLYTGLSRLVYDEPFYYGCYRDMTLLFMFDADERFRMSHSPSGGGYDDILNTTRPAWDFQFIIPEFDVDTEYGFSGRIVYRPRMSREEVMGEYERFKRD